jgi:tryptophan synthase alpha chain
MSRITARFQVLRRAGRKALIPYITAGDPRLELTVPLLHALVKAGADIIELGVPFSDPMADGTVIQRACERALAQGMSLHQVLAMVQAFRRDDQDTPLVLMGYLNPIEAMGYQAFAGAAAEAGVDGVLTVDMPPEEARELLTVLKAVDIDPIFLLAPTSSPERIQKVVALAHGYVYYVSLKGVTGAATLNVNDVQQKLATIRRYTDLPVGVGFGIRDAAAAAAVARLADAVVVGSALVARIESLAGEPERLLIEVGALLSSLRQAMDAGQAKATG